MNNHTSENRIKIGRRVLLLLATVITALAVAVTCALTLDSSKKVSVDSVDSAGVSTSANYSNLTGSTLKTYISNGSFTNGNYVDYTYSGGYRSVILPRGTYKFELWGAQGGYNGSYAANTGNATGGKGGYVSGQITYTADTTIYIYCGGTGAGGTGSIDGSNYTVKAGGYNGGGQGTGRAGSGGGGATDIRTSTSINNRIIVAAGGGGGNSTSYTQTHVSSGTLYYGGNGDTSPKHGSSSSWTNDEGGGGGGYYGGAVRHGDDPISSYCGSNYISGSFTSTSSGYGNASATGNGHARITAISVNQAPVSRNASITLPVRTGSTMSQSILASTLASDSDYANISGGSASNVYFTNGTSGAYDTFTTTANDRLYVNSACSKTASEYFDWTWGGSPYTTLTITKIKKYPRAGYDGCTTNGTITLYVKIRDNFGSGTASRAFAVIPFTVTVPANTITQRTNAAADVITATSAGGHKLYFGLSKTATAPVNSGIDTTNIYNPLGVNRYTAIFDQPLRMGEPVKINASDLIKGFSNSLDKIVASCSSVSAISGTARKYKISEYDATPAGTNAYNAAKSKLAYAYDTLTFECVTPDPAYQVFTVTVYEVEKTPVTALGLSNVEANTSTNAGGKTAITVDIVFKMDNTRPVIRNDLASGPVVTLGTLASTSVTLNQFYKDIDCANSNITSTSHTIREVIVPTHEFVQVNKYGEFQTTQNSKNSNKSYFNVLATTTPTDKFADVLTTGQLKGDAYKTGFESWYISNGSANTDKAYIQYSFSNDTLTITGLRATYSMYNTNRTSQSAITGGTTTSPTTTASVANAGHFYILLRVQDKNDTSDSGIWLPLGIQVTNRAPNTIDRERNGAGASEMPTANGDEGDTFYFTPMGITINQQINPIGFYKNANNQYTSSGLRPLAADADNYYTANMLNGQSLTTAGQTSIGKLNELVTIKSSITEIQNSIPEISYYCTVEFIDIYIPQSYFGGRVAVPANSTVTLSDLGGTACVKVQGLKITLKNWTHNRFLHLKVDMKDTANATCTSYIAVNVSNKAPEYLDSNKVAQLDYTTNGVTVQSTYTKPTGDGVATIKYRVPAHSTILITPYDLVTDSDMLAYLGANDLENGFTLNGLSGTYNGGVLHVAGDGYNGSGTNIEALATSANTSTANNGYNYAGASYTSNLFNMIGALQGTRTFSKVTTNNRFGTTASGSTWLDRLYFARSIDGASANLDGFSYNPYASTANRTSFSAPVVAGSEFVTYAFGTQISYKAAGAASAASYNLDYAIITATKRTASGSPAVIEFTVRDRTGANATGDSYGIQKIRVEIDVINSSPRVQYPNKYFTLTTNPIQNYDVRDLSNNQTTGFINDAVKPSTMVIYATNGGTDLSKNLLIDNEDGEVWFDVSGGCQVVDSPDVSGSESDSAGRSYNGNYVNVTITTNAITVTALNSTQAVQNLYIRFYATDGRYGDNGLLERSECYIRIEVVNAAFSYNTGDNGFEKVALDQTNTNFQYLWNVESITSQDRTRTRFFVSGSGAADAVRSTYSASAGQIKYLVSDTDALQGVVLSAATSPSATAATNVGYVNADVNASDKVTAYRNAVPQLGTTNNWSNSAAALIAIRNGNVYDTTNSLSDKVDLDNTDIVYFIKGENNSYTAYLAKTLKASGNFGDENFRNQFFDAAGRWKVTDWAIMVKPQSASDAGMYINLRLSMRDETALGGDTANKATAYKAGSADPVTVFGNQMLSYDLFINDIGIVPYTYYNQFDGYYTVADPADASGTVYVPTYDGTKSSQYDDDSTITSLYHVGNAITTTGSEAQLLTTRTAGGTDGTFAGVHAGMAYTRANAEATNGFSFDVRAGGTISAQYTESAFRYSDTIQISGESDVYTYVPMSYFALKQGFATINETDGTISFPTNSYVSYDIGSENGYDRRFGYRQAVTISDGVNTWSGGETNPYVTIEEYDIVDNYKQEDANKFIDSPYLNNCLSIPTYLADGTTEAFVSHAKTNSYAADIVGANGRIMYLADQTVVNRDGKYGLQEHMFGLKLKKNKTRAQAASLTITIKVVQCSFDSATNKTKANYGVNKAQSTAEVTFKLEIGNSPISLKASNDDSGVTYEIKKSNNQPGAGYYTQLLDLTTDSPTQYIALSRGTSVSGAKKVIQYEDADVTYKTENGREVVDETKSDTAKFSYNSLRQLQSLSGRDRVMELTGNSANTDITFANVSTVTTGTGQSAGKPAQLSISNYLSAWDKSSIEGMSGDYRPNGGIYAYNDIQGFDNYFSVGLSADATTLSITPKAKTTINADMISGNVADYYAQRGLKLIDPSNHLKGAYYPLKVLIYDDHGDGFESASYVALEIQIAIKGSAAKLSDNLEDYSSQTKDGSKKVNVALSIGQPYTLNLAHVITGGNLLKTTSNNIFWKADYDKLKADVDDGSKYAADPQRRLDDMFRLESGTYLHSPFESADNIQTYSTNARDLEQANSDLRNGRAKFSSNPSYEGIRTSNLPDVIMYMGYYRLSGGAQVQSDLKRNDVPIDNNIIFRVNRRTTYQTTENNVTVSKQQNSFTFELSFEDSDGNKTKKLYVNIDVINQTPNIRTKATNAAANIQMQVGDRFTVLTTPYNRFVGSEALDTDSAYTTPTASARASTSYLLVSNRATNSYAGITEANLLGRNAAVPYEQLTERAMDGELGLHSYDRDGGSNQHLGYIALADDDMPWGLRIESVSYYDDKCFEPTKRSDGIPLEGSNTSTGTNYCLDVTIQARAVCNNMPITITLVDSDMAIVTFTMYVTVVSSKPVAIDYGDTQHKLNAALSPVYTTVMEQQQLQHGIYSMYMISDNVTNRTTTETINNASTVTSTYKEVTLTSGSRVKAYGKVRLPIDEIAYDPDSGDVLALYNEDRGADEAPYNVMSLNGSALNKNGNVYSNDIFRIEISSDYRWFTIECNTYNNQSDMDVLRFYVRDSGNNVYENAIPIEIRICTLYSSITNDAQMTNTAIRQEQFQRGSIASVNVKSFDDYNGTSIDLPTDEVELNKIRDVQSTFQFLTYPDMPASVDQTATSAKPINDPDVVKNKANLNYELRIYAFMANVNGSESEFEAVSLENISTLFNLNASIVNKKVLALKSDTDLRDNAYLNEKQIGINNFLIGGFYSDGVAITNVNRSLTLFLQRYFMFEVGDDGVSLNFKPISANHGVDIPLYVQVTKYVSDSRAVLPADVDTVCGDIFYVNVQDSAPIATDENGVLKFSGKVGDSAIFKLYDTEDPFGSLFTDSDINDYVVYDGFVSDRVLTPDYTKAMQAATAKELDWRAVESVDKPQAVTIAVNNSDVEVNGIPAYSVKITINRRIDERDSKGNYLDKVPLPVIIYGKDRGGLTASVEVEITIENSDIDIDKSKITEVTADPKNGYYQLSVDESKDRSYFIDAYVVPGKTLTPFYFVDKDDAKTWITDPDYKRMRTDTDSMRLVGKEGATSETYLMYGKTLSVTSAKQSGNVATITPIFGNDVMPEDANHFVGFSIEAHTANREIDDATATMRIIDRSGDPEITTNGFTVTVRIHILNAPPTLKDIDKKPFVVTGSSTKDGDPIVVDINDYVEDLNNDKLKIVGVSAVYGDSETSNLHCELDSESAGDLVNIAISDNNTTCSFIPKKGYYGEQTISIMVADIIEGDDTASYGVAEFTIDFVIGYNIADEKLNDITAIRSLPTVVKPSMLFRELSDTYGIKDHATEQPGKFNPGADYVITDLSASGVVVRKDGDDWVFVSDKVADQVKFNVTFKNKSAVDDPNVKSINMSFNASIGKNHEPKLLDNFKNQKEEGYLFQTGNGQYDLNNNGTVLLTPSMLFSDADIEVGDKLTFDAKTISVSAPTICSVRVSDDGTQLYLTFNCRGECDLTVGVMDLTGETTKVTFKVKNIDRPDPSFWDKIVISYEVYPFIWWGVGAGILLIIALIILIVLLLKRRKRKREELEAILISEMELEEQMMRLGAGSMGAMPYQSYGYLPPTMNIQNDPNLMLGSGAAAPTPGAIGLNPGAPGDNGVPTDSDM
ncbi:MAG: hypothetical protein K2M47_01390 [Clostridiales bacterium]|nr:hypothetical protein [Clostridiales bacterium]